MDQHLFSSSHKKKRNKLCAIFMPRCIVGQLPISFFLFALPYTHNLSLLRYLCFFINAKLNDYFFLFVVFEIDAKKMHESIILIHSRFPVFFFDVLLLLLLLLLYNSSFFFSLCAYVRFFFFYTDTSKTKKFYVLDSLFVYETMNQIAKIKIEFIVNKKK